MKRIKAYIAVRRSRSLAFCILSDALFVFVEELTPKEYLKGELVNVVLNWIKGLDPIQSCLTFASSLIN